jgi:hypothetical protein
LPRLATVSRNERVIAALLLVSAGMPALVLRPRRLQTLTSMALLVASTVYAPKGG